jgi:hypothetical protein
MSATGRAVLMAWRCAAALFLSSGLLSAAFLPVLIQRGPVPLAGLGLLLAMTWLGIGTACLAAVALAPPPEPRRV